jgi:hypothetical protein
MVLDSSGAYRGERIAWSDSIYSVHLARMRTTPWRDAPHVMPLVLLVPFKETIAERWYSLLAFTMRIRRREEPYLSLRHTLDGQV